MAHYAKLGLDNIVLNVEVVDTIDCMTRGGIEREEIGLEKLQQHSGHMIWKKCSFNTREGVRVDPVTNEVIPDSVGFRANYPGIGWYYSTEHDLFHPPRPTDEDGDLMNSWTLNTTTGMWDPPIVKPTLTDEQMETTMYRWDESAHQTDNTTGWVLRDRFPE